MVPFTLPLRYTEITQFTYHCTFWNPFVALVDLSVGSCLFRKLVGQIVPLVSSVCINPVDFYLPVLHLHFYHFHPDFFNEVCVVFRFLSDSNVIRLSVDIISVLSLVSMYCVFSSAFSISSY